MIECIYLPRSGGRPIPDVSVQGDHYQIIWQGEQVGISGASTSTPTFASIIALINGARLNSGKSPLGWLNPMLYTKGIPGLNDIVEGSNPGCGFAGFNVSQSRCCISWKSKNADETFFLVIVGVGRLGSGYWTWHT